MTTRNAHVPARKKKCPAAGGGFKVERSVRNSEVRARALCALWKFNMTRASPHPSRGAHHGSCTLRRRRSKPTKNATADPLSKVRPFPSQWGFRLSKALLLPLSPASPRASRKREHDLNTTELGISNVDVQWFVCTVPAPVCTFLVFRVSRSTPCVTLYSAT